MFTAAQFTIAKCWKQPKGPSVNEWIKKLWYIYTMEFYASGRKKELLPFCNSMNGTGEQYAKGHKGKNNQMGPHQNKKLLHG